MFLSKFEIIGQVNTEVEAALKRPLVNSMTSINL